MSIPEQVYCRWRDPAAPDDGRSLHCGNIATDISYSTHEGRVLDALCDLHRDRGLVMLEVDGKNRTLDHSLLAGSVQGVIEAHGSYDADGVFASQERALLAENILEALFRQPVRAIVRRHLAEREANDAD